MQNRTVTPAAPASDRHSLLAWVRARLPVMIAGLAFAVVAGVTGRVSYLHIEALSVALHQPPQIARIMPFGIDGLIVVGSVALLQAKPDQEWLGWVCVGPGTAASLFANVESGWRYGALSAFWAGMASVGFFVATFTLERWLKAQAAETGQPAPAARPAPGPAPAAAGPEPAAVIDPGAPEPQRREAVLRALLGAGTQREVAGWLGVPKTRVGNWSTELKRGGTLRPEPSRDVPPRDAEAYWSGEFEPAAGAPQGHAPAALNGSAPGA